MKGHGPLPYDKPEFSGVSSFMRLPVTSDLKGVDFAIIGVPFDTGASWRVGSRFAPSAIRSVSGLLWPYDVRRRMDLFDYVSGVDYGDLPVIPGYAQQSFEAIRMGLEPVISQRVVPILLGGDHSITLPCLRCVAHSHGPVALVHFDSHPDTWPLYFGQPHWHGSPIINALQEGLIRGEATTQLGLRGSLDSLDPLEQAQRYGVRQFFAEDIHEGGWEKALSETLRRAGGFPVYVTFDIDFLDPSQAPGTGTPEVGGFTVREAIKAIRALETLNIVAFDLVEVLPAYDVGEITSLAAANLAYEFVGLLAERQRRGMATR